MPLLRTLRLRRGADDRETEDRVRAPETRDLEPLDRLERLTAERRPDEDRLRDTPRDRGAEPERLRLTDDRLDRDLLRLTAGRLGRERLADDRRALLDRLEDERPTLARRELRRAWAITSVAAPRTINRATNTHSRLGVVRRIMTSPPR